MPTITQLILQYHATNKWVDGDGFINQLLAFIRQHYPNANDDEICDAYEQAATKAKQKRDDLARSRGQDPKYIEAVHQQRMKRLVRSDLKLVIGVEK